MNILDLTMVFLMWAIIIFSTIYIAFAPDKQDRWHMRWHKQLQEQGRWDGDTGRRTSIIRQMPLKWRGED